MVPTNRASIKETTKCIGREGNSNTDRMEEAVGESRQVNTVSFDDMFDTVWLVFL